MGEVKRLVLDEATVKGLKTLDDYFDLQMEDGRGFDEWLRERVNRHKKRRKNRHPLNVTRYGS